MTAPTNPCVIDTNVPLTANGGEDPKCRLACVGALAALMRSGRLVIDDKFLILNEYKRKLSPSGQPGVGDRFLKWALTNQSNPERCERVELTPSRREPSSSALSSSRPSRSTGPPVPSSATDWLQRLRRARPLNLWRGPGGARA